MKHQLMWSQGRHSGTRECWHAVLGLFLAGLLVVSSAPALAQESGDELATDTTKPKKSLGIYALVNWATLGGDAETFGNDLASALELTIGGNWAAEKGTRTGFGLGLSSSLPLSQTFRLQLGVQYIQRGVTYKLTESTSNLVVDTKLKMDYLEVPVLGRFVPAVNGPLAPVFVFGPVLGLNVSSKLSVEVDGQSDSTDMKDETKSTHLGGLLGVGGIYQINPKTSLILQVQYFASFTNQIDDPTYSMRSGDFSIVLGVDFLAN